MLDSVLACKIYFAVHNDNSVGENALSIKKYPHWVKQGRPRVFRNKYLTLLNNILMYILTFQKMAPWLFEIIYIGSMKILLIVLHRALAVAFSVSVLCPKVARLPRGNETDSSPLFCLNPLSSLGALGL